MKVSVNGRARHYRTVSFDARRNEVVLIDREGDMEEFGLMTKYEVGQRILDRVAGMLGPLKS